MRRFLVVLFFLIGPAPIPPALADNETVVITATRTPQPADKTGESISVITAEDLDRQQIVSLADVFQEVPGLTVVRNGGLGQNATLSIRGAEAGQTLVLVDGIRINDPSTVDNEALLGDLLVNNLERVEILRGPQSTLYGSDAIGGVVDTITRRGGDTSFGLRASAEAGSFDTYRFNAAAAGTLGGIEYGAAANLLHSVGISAADSRNGNPETDGYSNAGLTENVRVTLSPEVSVDLRSYYTNARADFDDNFLFLPPASFRVADSAAYERNTLLAGYMGLNVDLFGGDFTNRFAATGTESHRAFYDSAFDSVHKNASDAGNVSRLEYQGTLEPFPGDQLTFGAEYQRISFTGRSFSSFSPVDTETGDSRTSSVYAENMLTLAEGLTLTAGLRHDDDREFGGHNSVKLAAAWKLGNRGTVLHANYGDGFKAPTLYEQFSQFSNPLHALAPEVAHGWEAGIDQPVLNARIVLHATWFERRTEDQIDFFVPNCFSNPPPDVCKTRPFGYYDNIARTRAQGLEVSATASIAENLTSEMSLTQMTAQDLVTGLDLARRPHMTASGTLNWLATADLGLGATLIYVGRRFDSAGEVNPLSPYSVVNLFGSYNLTESIALYGRVENAFDRRYEPVFGYGAPGRAVYGGLRLRL